MGKITIIAAIGKNLELGYNNDLIWKIPEDLKFFRDNTMGKTIVMGLNTFISLPKKLPNRKHIVLTRKDIYIDDNNEEIMIIGGAMIYNEMINHADKMLLTEIYMSAKADVYFPKFSLIDWDREIISNHKYEDINYSHVVYMRKRVK